MEGRDKIMKTTLLIMAAGIGSRFGGGIKQLEPVDSNGHITITDRQKDMMQWKQVSIM